MARSIAPFDNQSPSAVVAKRASAPRQQSPEQEQIEALVATTAPAILRLLDDGVPRSKRMIMQALADTHAKADLTRTLMRLSVTGRLQCDAKQRFVLPSEPEPASRAKTG